MATNNGGTDPISHLPETVMGHILSLLTMKEAVATRVLSKKWIQFWENHFLLLHHLNFDSSHFRTRNQTLFMDYVDHVLHLRGPIDIDKLTLKYHEFRHDDLPRVSHWIHHAASRCHMKKLELEIHHVFPHNLPRPDPVWFPADVFSGCSSLVELKLNNDFVFDVPPPTLPCLKVLHVDVRQPNINFLNCLFGCSPVLENLSIYGELPFDDDIGFRFEISVPTITTLKIELASPDDFEGCSEHNFNIQTPNLQFLTIQDQIFACYVIPELPSLVEANVGIGPDSRFINNGDISEEEALRVMLVLKGIRHARSLTLWETATAALGHAFDDFGPLPKFPNLLRLDLCIDSCYGWKLLPHFLTNSPNLEFIKMDKQVPFVDEGEAAIVPDEVTYGWDQPGARPFCLGLNLKEIQMKSLWRSGDEEDVLRYLLWNSMVLETMVINFSEDALEGELDDEDMIDIEDFPRVSERRTGLGWAKSKFQWKKLMGCIDGAKSV
ncbi:hypothetical protein COLO4_16363 [Corchorus olitorius]|uniref:F-box domain-containing protein n=1 Tax=Corchorus olitorius TaxID=93759 RepID=A0A1R3JHM6_9ROSI|nr:hypothetical protein COLO4_16363 [Corchorus olitorius]